MNHLVRFCRIIGFFCISGIVFLSCNSEEEAPAELYISELTKIDHVSFRVLVSVKPGTSSIREVGYVWGESPAPDLQSGNVVTNMNGSFLFSDTISGLKPNTTYYFRAYSIDEGNVPLYSLERSSTTGMHNIDSFTPGVVSAGMNLIIRGDFAPGNSKVYFDDVEVPIKDGSSSALIVEVPFGLTNDQIKVSVDLSGQRLTFENTLEYRKGRWVELNDMDDVEEDNRFPFAAVHDKKAYVLGSNGILFTYDVTSGIWEKKSEHPVSSDLNTTRRGFFVGGELYTTTYTTRDVWKYSVTENTWSVDDEQSPIDKWFPGSGVAFGYFDGRYAGLGVKVEEGGEFSYTNEFWSYNPHLGWSALNDFPGKAVRYATSVVVSNIGPYLIGGRDINDNPVNEVWKYDPVGDSWERKADYPGLGTAGSVAFEIGGKIYVGGGHSLSDSPTNHQQDFWEYTPSRDTWVRVLNFPYTGTWMYSFVIDGVGYVGGGYRSDCNGCASRPVLKLWKFEVQ